MKRHFALQPLSRDHHNVLLHARRLRGEDHRIDAQAAQSRFLRFYDAVLNHHFTEEEAFVWPLLEPEVRNTLQQEHDVCRRLVERSRQAADVEVAHRLGVALRDHVRGEELAFEKLQAVASEEVLMEIAHASRAMRAHVRPASANSPESENCFL